MFVVCVIFVELRISIDALLTGDRLWPKVLEFWHHSQVKVYLSSKVLFNLDNDAINHDRH